MNYSTNPFIDKGQVLLFKNWIRNRFITEADLQQLPPLVALALFTSRPSIPVPQLSTPENDPYWDEITKNFAHEHSDNNSSSVAFETTPLLNTGVREQTAQRFEVAHEQCNGSCDKVVIETTSILDTQLIHQNSQGSYSSNKQPKYPQKINQWVEPYYVTRAGKKYRYHRYCWMSSGSRKQHRTHIGSTSSKAAIEKRAIVLQMIIDDALPEEIISYLKQER